MLPYWTTPRYILEMIYAICLLLIATGFVMAALTDYTLKQYNDPIKQRIHRQVLRNRTYQHNYE